MPTFLQYKDHMCMKNRIYKGKINLYFTITWSILEITRIIYVFSRLFVTGSQFSVYTIFKKKIHSVMQKHTMVGKKNQNAVSTVCIHKEYLWSKNTRDYSLKIQFLECYSIL